MRAVNLIPSDGSHAGAGRAGRSNGAAHLLLAALAGLVVLATLWTLAGRDATDRRAELKSLQAQVVSAQAQAATVAGYGSYAALRTGRTQTVKSLVAARFDWAGTLDAIARLLPRDMHLSALGGTIAGAAAPGAATSPTTAADPSSAASLQVTGCAPSQAAVARLMPRLRAVPGVGDVSLTSSTAVPSVAGTAQGPCGGIDFVITLSFVAPTKPAPTAPAAGVAQ